MKKKTYRIVLIVAISILTLFGVIGVFNAAANAQEYINLNISIPLPNCPGQLGDSVRCEGNLVTGVKDAPALVVALFQFGIILGAVIMVAIMVIGGLMILASAGFQSRVQQAREMITRSGFALLVLIFSVVIITQVNPRLLNLTLTDTGSDVFDTINVCKNFLDEPSCSADETCLWSGSTCLAEATASCTEMSIEAACGTKVGCEWIASAQKCVEPKNQNQADCETFTQSNHCANGQACIWERGCTVIELQTVIDNFKTNTSDPTNSYNPQTLNPCVKYDNPNNCNADPLCAWQQGGACFSEKDALSRPCNLPGFQNENNCPFSCKWDDDIEACVAGSSVGLTCEEDGDCSNNHFCAKETNTCQERLPLNDTCDGVGNDDDDRVCDFGLYCNDTPGIGTNECTSCDNASVKSPVDSLWCNGNQI
jgi:hypothetical protein